MSALSKLAVVSCVLAAGNGAMKPLKNIVDLVMRSPSSSDFSNLVTSLQAAGLLPLLQGTQPFTVFAPNNDAFEKMHAEELSKLLKDKDALANVLTYHIAAGELFMGDLLQVKTAETLQGGHVDVWLNYDHPLCVKVNDATVLTPDVEAANGVVHVIDSVLSPPPPPSPTSLQSSGATVVGMAIEALKQLSNVAKSLNLDESRILTNWILATAWLAQWWPERTHKSRLACTWALSLLSALPKMWPLDKHTQDFPICFTLAPVMLIALMLGTTIYACRLTAVFRQSRHDKKQLKILDSTLTITEMPMMVGFFCCMAALCALQSSPYIEGVDAAGVVNEYKMFAERDEAFSVCFEGFAVYNFAKLLVMVSESAATRSMPRYARRNSLVGMLTHAKEKLAKLGPQIFVFSCIINGIWYMLPAEIDSHWGGAVGLKTWSEFMPQRLHDKVENFLIGFDFAASSAAVCGLVIVEEIFGERVNTVFEWSPKLKFWSVKIMVTVNCMNTLLFTFAPGIKDYDDNAKDVMKLTLVICECFCLLLLQMFAWRPSDPYWSRAPTPGNSAFTTPEDLESRATSSNSSLEDPLLATTPNYEQTSGDGAEKTSADGLDVTTPSSMSSSASSHR